jgi:hypothetical protein
MQLRSSSSDCVRSDVTSSTSDQNVLPFLRHSFIVSDVVSGLNKLSVENRVGGEALEADSNAKIKIHQSMKSEELKC